MIDGGVGGRAARYVQKPAFECQLFREWRRWPVLALPLGHNPRGAKDEPLFDRVDIEFEKALAGAIAAFEAGDRTEALRLFELAVAITPNNPAR